MIGQTATPRLSDEPDIADFLRKLSLELASGDVRLPSFPGIAMRVQQVLDDPKASRERIVKVIGADTALAARILKLANSAFLRPSTKAVTDLAQVVTILGHQLVRCTAVSFSLQQMDLNNPDLKPLLRQLWLTSTLIASIAHVLAHRTRAKRSDEAMVAGLMQSIGQLFILANSPKSLLRHGGSESWQRAVHTFHPRIGSSILKHWKFPASIVTAVANQNTWDRKLGSDEYLTDLVSASTALAPCAADRSRLSPELVSTPPFQRLSLSLEDCKTLFIEAGGQIKELHAALTF